MEKTLEQRVEALGQTLAKLRSPRGALRNMLLRIAALERDTGGGALAALSARIAVLEGTFQGVLARIGQLEAWRVLDAERGEPARTDHVDAAPATPPPAPAPAPATPPWGPCVAPWFPCKGCGTYLYKCSDVTKINGYCGSCRDLAPLFEERAVLHATIAQLEKQVAFQKDVPALLPWTRPQPIATCPKGEEVLLWSASMGRWYATVVRATMDRDWTHWVKAVQPPPPGDPAWESSDGVPCRVCKVWGFK